MFADKNNINKGDTNGGITLCEKPREDANAAFGRIYDEWYGPLFYLLLRLTGSGEHAKDIVHDVFLRLWEKRGVIDTAEGLKPYLFAATRNAAASLFRKLKAERNYLASSVAAEASGSTGGYGAPYEQAVSREMELLTEYAMSRMPGQRRRVFELSYRDGLSPAEIASELGITPRSVSDHLYEARSAIQKLFLVLAAIGLLQGGL